MTFLGLAACILLAIGGCARLVTAPTAEPDVGTSAAYTVLNGDDSGTGSLRQVVADAPADGIVTFDASVTTVTLTSAPITIDKDLTILGPDGGTVTISGSDTVSVFVVTSGGVDAVLQNLTITRGQTTGDGGGARVEAQVGTEGWSSLTLVDCTVAENRADGVGGGVYVNGRLVMERTTVRDNQAVGKGGGVAFHGSVPSDAGMAAYIRNSTFVGNWGAEGGGFANAGGGATIEFSTFSGNRSGYDFHSTPWGGGIHSYNSTTRTTLLGTIVVGNVAAYDGTPTDLFGSTTVSTDTPFVSLGYNLIGVGGGSANIETVFTVEGDDVGVTSADVVLQALADNGGPTQTIALGAGSQAIDAVPESACLDASGVALAVDQRGVARPQGTNCDIGAFEATPVSYAVTSSADDGTGSLRQIVGFAPAGTTITVDPSVSSVILTSGHIVIDKDLTIAGPEGGTVTIDAGGASRVLDVKNGYNVVLSNLTITGGYADHGAGVLLESGASLAGSLTLIDCTVAGNHASGSDAVRGDGGGLYVYGTLRMERTTVRGNTAGSFGGGVFHDGTVEPSASIVNSTFTGNVAQSGGAIHNEGGGMTIAFSTIAGNRTTLTYGGGISLYNPEGSEEIRLRGTIVVGNSTTGGTANDLHRWFSTTHFVTLGYNLVGTASGFSAAGVFVATGDLAGLTDVGLQALADNGGATQTMALGEGSQAIDAVPAEACLDAADATLEVDQRGVARPQPEAGTCDIGAFELVPVAPPPVTYVVSSSGDSGTGTLRQMLLDAPAGTTITFAPEVTEVNLTDGSLVLDKDVTIAGPEDGTVTIRGDGATFRVIYIATPGVQVTLRNLTITQGHTNLSGGGIAVEAWDLGNEPSPSLRLERCSVVGNYAGTGGGGLLVMGDFVMDATTVSGNTTGSSGWGGGLAHYGTSVGSSVAYPSSATIVNSTFSGNTAYKGGGIENENGSLRILFSTVTGNTATSSAGGILGYNDAVTRTTVKGTIAVGNTSPAGADDVSAISTTNRFDSLGYNVIGAGSGNVDFTQEFTATGDLTGVSVSEAGLLDLADYGGPTLTHALTSGSVASNRVPLADCIDLAGTTLATDQRGVARPQGSACESGAFEYDGTVTEYVLAASVAPEDSGTVAGAGTYEGGAIATLTATRAEHWTFSHWSGDLSGSDNPATLTMNADKTVVANFTQVLYPVTETLDGGGTVRREPSGSAYPYGTTVTVTALPTDEWHFAEWTGALMGSSLSGSFEVTGAMAYTAHFTQWYLLTTAIVGEGGVARSPSGEYFEPGTPVTLTATPVAGWRFDHWSGDLTGSSSSETVTMDAAKTVTATFVLDTYTVSTTVEGNGSVAGDGTYPAGTTVTLTPTPDAAWTFVGWTGDVISTDDPLVLVLKDDLDIVATFAPVITYTVDVTIEGGGKVGLDPEVGPYEAGSTVSLTPVADAGWHFDRWSGDLTEDANPATLTMDANKAITATFVQDVVTYTVTTNVDGDGEVLGGGTYEDGATATLTAVADPGSTFDHWSGDADGSNATIDLTVNSNLDVTAHFVGTGHTLDVTAQGEGYVVVEPSPGPYADGTPVTLEAFPVSGWYFQGWTGAITGSTNPVTLEMHASMAITAIFQPELGPLVTVALDGAGHVTSVPEGIDCGASGGVCRASFPRNTKLTLTGVAADGAAFLRWTGSVVDIAPDLDLRLREDVTVTAHFIGLNGPVVAIDPTGSFRGNTAVVTGSLVCEDDTFELEVFISQVVPVKKAPDVTVTASTKVYGAMCGQPWMATLVADVGRFARGEAEVTVTIEGGTEPKTRTVELR